MAFPDFVFGAAGFPGGVFQKSAFSHPAFEGSVSERFSKIWEWFWPLALAFLGKLVLVLVIFFAGKKLIRLLLRLVKKGFERARVEEGVAGFVDSVLKVILYFLLVVITANVAGVATTSAVALVGSVGLTVGMALQGSLSNFAGGVLLLMLKPFGIGDYIVAQELEGTVAKIDLFYTTMLTTDNRTVVLPNGTLSNGNIINVTREPERRLDLLIPVSYQDDIRKVRTLLLSIAEHHANRILPEHDVVFMVSNFGENAVEIAFRVWVKKEDYWALRSDLLEEIKDTFDEQGITIPVRQVNIRVDHPL